MEEEKGLVKTEENQVGLMQQGISLFFDIARFEHAQRVARLLSTSTMVPDQFRGENEGIANCLIALNLAERMRVDPFMLMQTMYVVHGKPGIEAKLAIALFNAESRNFETPIQFEKVGKDYPKSDDSKCRAFAKSIKTDEVLHGEWITWELVKKEGWYDKNGSKWKTMPGQMFVYRSAMFFIREYDPGVLLGLRTKDELNDMVIDVTPISKAKNLDEISAEDHVGYEVEQVEKETEPKLLQCPHCNHAPFKTKGRYENHLQKEHPQTPALVIDDQTEQQKPESGESDNDPQSAWYSDDFFKDQIEGWKEELGLPAFNGILARFNAMTIDGVAKEHREACWMAMSAEADKKNQT